MPESGTPSEKLCIDERCSVAGPQPLSSFPRYAASRDGRKSYCSKCNNRRCAEYKASAKRKAEKSAPSEYPLADDLQRLIRSGVDTFAGLRMRTGKSSDAISDALAFLLLDAQDIRTERKPDGTARYLPASARTRFASHTPRRATTEPALSFSTVGGLMSPLRVTGTAR